jgi:hypothetical protein
MALKQTTALSFLAALSFSILAYYQTFQLSSATESSPQYSLMHDMPLPLPDVSSTAMIHHDYSPIDEADYIIQRSFSETYARMAHCEDDEVEKECIDKVVDTLKQQKMQYNQLLEENNANTPLQPLPWWFQTLLRDIPTNGAYGFWHHFSTSSTNPPMKFCAIGKNGSTEWRKVFKELNAPEFGGVDKSKFNTKMPLRDDAPLTVFLRDPLERLLSAYLDKCVKDGVRKSQGHCEPNAIFAQDWIDRRAASMTDHEPKDGKEGIMLPNLSDAAQDSEKEMFAAYVDLFPLKWNVHFVPQAIFCDLYRTIDSYDTYYMGKTFMSELDRISTNYGGMLPDTLNTIFDYKSQLDKLNSTDGVVNVGADNAHGTKAPTKVAQYYSPRAVRRALEYLSIDYVSLGLEVPEWAREMLRTDGAARQY